MHPQLSDRKLGQLGLSASSHCLGFVSVCKEFMDALEQCHSNNWARLLGYCNNQKAELNSCLRKERIERTAENRETANEKKIKVAEARKKFYGDE
ncbi:hypothetical protein C8F04DRAFT_938583 [Mycena alexandri]|uniref:COX assembly mitochondrial protein n=1 Tax=Mycena alexandri TaxID=1745969 RepID=A0AAD6TKD9_9AGAR|nr:hypothetical protein C8F04DRAFT_938583 [Mycena alexandri]